MAEDDVEGVGGPEGADQEVDDGSFDGGQGAAQPEPQATPEQQQPAAQPDPATAHMGGLQGNPLWPVLQHLPPALMRQVQGGQLTAEQAVARHYGGKRWSNLVQTETAHRELQQQNQGLVSRFEMLVKHLTDTLGVALPEELQPKEEQPPSEVGQLGQKVDQLLETVEDQRVERVVGEVQGYVESEREAALQADPEYAAAEEFVSNRLIEFQTTQVQQAINAWSLSKDPQILAQNFTRERLEQLVNGEISEEQLVTLTALDRCFDIVAQTHTKHYREGTSYTADVLGIAQKMGWQRGQGGGQPAAAAQPSRPAQPRRDPNLDAARRRGGAPVPGPARTGPAPLDARQVVERVSKMSTEDFERMLNESDDPDKTMDALLKMTAVR